MYLQIKCAFFQSLWRSPIPDKRRFDKGLLPARFATSAPATTAARTATAAATAPVATETTGAATAVTGAFGSGSSFVHVDGPAIQAGAIKCGNRAVCFRRVRHLDKGEAAGLASIAIPDQIDSIHGPVLFE
jgi:hypothetical protein